MVKMAKDYIFFVAVEDDVMPYERSGGPSQGKVLLIDSGNGTGVDEGAPEKMSGSTAEAMTTR